MFDYAYKLLFLYSLISIFEINIDMQKLISILSVTVGDNTTVCRTITGLVSVAGSYDLEVVV